MKQHYLDLERSKRLGFPEVVYGAGKSIETLISIVTVYQKKNENVLITRLQANKASALSEQFTGSYYHAESSLFMLYPCKINKDMASVCIITAGSSDIPVANEAYHTLQFLGIAANRINDIGVAGIHRLMSKAGEIQNYQVLIVVAGFEGALPSVMGGMFSQPIIAVPTSTGYGVARNGETALFAMLSSCANGISVVNIDNGYGAALAAFRILQHAHQY
ncbi:MAG: nickel pincer cofactor biosynthesis protein LarB [Carboxylicivirga sp.]|jgi:NCAIR mutase (PurE)-related protein|nr:nickel pincer cofactor biosynthesis protein LarB [Carboxylicivirga sp.]MCT4646250.1 nickel pincer cofactor biosynthesis protein LarB [Carboxylicivirga sp.]